MSILGLLSTLCGVMSLIVSFIPCFGMLAIFSGTIGLMKGILALVFTFIGNSRNQGKGLPIAGVVTNALSIVVALIMIFVVKSFFGGPATNTDAEVENADAIKITAMQLAEDYSTNVVKAEANYNGKVLEVTGLVKLVSKERIGRITVELGSGNNTIDCDFGSSGQSELAGIEVGQLATIRGKCKGLDRRSNYVILESCKLVKDPDKKVDPPTPPTAPTRPTSPTQSTTPTRPGEPDKSLAQLDDPEPEVRAAAAKALGAKGASAHPAITKLVALLGDKDKDVAEAASAAILGIGRAQPTVLVDFKADWCAPCRQTKPIVEKLRAEGLPILTVDIDQYPALSTRFKIEFVPSFLVIRDGQALTRETGARSEEALRKMMKGLSGAGGKLSLEGTASQARAMALMLAMSGDDEWAKFLSEEELKTSGGEAAPVLKALVGGKYPDRIRIGATMALPAVHGKSIPPDLAALLAEKLADEKESPDVRGYTALALSQMKADGPKVIPTLREALGKGTRPGLRALAAEKLGDAHAAEAVPELIGRLADDSATVRTASAKALGAIGGKAGRAVPALLEAFESDREGLREVAREALQQIVPSADEGTPAVVKALRSKDDQTRLLALQLLETVGDPQTAAEALRKLLEDENAGVRVQAAVALQRIGQDDGKVLRILAGSLKDEEENYAAEEALRSAGRKGMPLILASLTDPDLKALQRLRAVRLVEGAQRPGTKPPAALTAALASTVPDIATCAALALARQTPDDPAVQKALTSGLASKELELRRACIRALGTTKSASVIPALIAVLKDEKDLRSDAAMALSQLPLDEKGAAELLAMLKTRATRTDAARALAFHKVHRATAAGALVAAFAAAKEREEREPIGESLQAIGKPAYTLLIDLAANAGKKEEIRVEALVLLGRMGEDEIDRMGAGERDSARLEKLLKDPSERIRTRAAIALAYAGTEADVTDLLMKAIEKGEDDDSADEARSALSVHGVKGAAAVDRLIEMAKKGDANKRSQNIQLLGSVGGQSEKAAAAVVPLMKADEDPAVRLAARSAMYNFGDRAVGKLAEALGDAKYSRPDLLAALQQLGPQAKPAQNAIAKLLDDKDRAIAIAAGLALAAVDPKLAAAVPLLIEGAQSQDDAIREQAIFALGGCGANAKSAVPLLVRALESRRMRYAALSSLGRLGPIAAEAVPALTRQLDSPERDSAAEALGQIGKAAAPAIPRLLKMLESERTMNGAARALGRIGGDAKRAVPLLVAKLPDPDLAIAACSALQEVGHLDTEAALPGLRKAATGADAETRAAAVRALGALKSAKSVEDVLGAMKDPELSVRIAAIQSLGQLGPLGAGALDVLTEASRSKEPQARRSALGSLGALGAVAKPAVPEIAKLLTDKECRYDALYALGRIGPGAASAVPDLMRLLDDPEARHSAVVALGKIGPDAKAALPKLKALAGARERSHAQAAANAIAIIEGKAPNPSDDE